MPLTPADEAESRERDRLSHAVWGEDLSVDAFVEREALLRRTPWASSARAAWSWSAGGKILSSCETYRMSCTLDGEPGTAWGIASVFTEPALRGRGHARAMIDAVADRLARRPDARALILFSDVDPGIYRSIGFVERPALDRIWTEDPGPTPVAARSGRFRVVPEPAQLDWHREKDRITDALVGGTSASVGTRRVWLLDLVDRDDVSRAFRSGRAREVRAWETGGWPEGLGVRVPREGAVPMIRPLHLDVRPEDWTWIPRGVWV